MLNCLNYLCCLGEKTEPISKPTQIAGYQYIFPTISIKIWYLRLFFGIICWASTIYSIIFTTLTYQWPYGLNFLSWFIYYTNWTMIIQRIYWVLVIYLHHKIVHNQQKHIYTNRKFIKLFNHIKVLNIIGVCAGIGVAVGPMVLPGHRFAYNGTYSDLYAIDDVFRHGINAGIIGFDFYCGLMIYRYKDVWILMIFALIYQIFNFIYIISGGTDSDGNDYIYTIYDFNNDPLTATWQVGIFLISHFGGYLVVAAFVKKVILYRYLSKQINLDVTGTNVETDSSTNVIEMEVDFYH